MTVEMPTEAPAITQPTYHSENLDELAGALSKAQAAFPLIPNRS